MILQKCPRCQRDLMVEVKGRAEPFQCDRCGHQWANRPVKRRIAGPGIEQPSAQRPTQVADVRAQAQQIVKRPARAQKVDTPSPGGGPEASGSRRPTLRIKGYDILDCRGKGGMGKVYRAVQKSLGREVAIKTLDSNLARNQASIWRFTKEAAAMAQLRHPNILFVIDRGKERNVHYFVMEYVDGPSLREMLRMRDDGRFTSKEALHIMLQLARTMAYAHKQGVVHRDLKPENILYNSDKCLKVADFGLAGVNRETTYIKQLTKSYVSMGTECYMAPEQRHDAKKVDQRADIYSLGVILYELIRGELPFPSLPPPEQPIVEGRRDIDAIIRCCLAYDKEHRYPTTDDLVLALEKALNEGEKAPVAVVRDTVVDTPALSAFPPLQQRIDQWMPEDFQESRPGEEHFSVSWQPRSRRWLRGALAFAGILGVVVLFFMLLAPRPRSSQKVDPNELWKRLEPEVQQVDAGRVRYHFRFAGKPEKNLLGRLPEPQWRLAGNWFAHKGAVHQNTFRRDFVRNRKALWAVFRGATLRNKGFRFRATLQMLRPWHSHGISRREYFDKHHATTPLMMGMGWKGGPLGQTTLQLQRKKDNLTLHLQVGRRTSSRTQCSSQTPMNDDWTPQQYKWGRALKAELRLEPDGVSAWIDGRQRCHVKVPVADQSTVKPGLLCQNAHCVFQQVQIDAFSKSTTP